MESHAAPTLDLHQLSGKWRMLYTTARDVIPLVRANTLPSFLPQPLRVGPIFQEFDDRGGVRNVIEAEALLPPGRGTCLTFQVEARYQRRGPRSLGLRFVAAGVPHLEPSASLRAFLAPALAPRGWWTHRLLLAAQQVGGKVARVFVLGLGSSRRGGAAAGRAGGHQHRHQDPLPTLPLAVCLHRHTSGCRSCRRRSWMPSQRSRASTC